MATTFTQKQLDPLYDLGLNKIQALIYLAVLRHGIQSVLELSKLTGINRQQIYQGAEKLLELGLLEVTRKNRRKYIAANPNKLVKISNEKVMAAERVREKIAASIPFLELLPKSNTKKANILYFEGIEKLKEAYEKELSVCKNTEVLSFVGSIDDTYEFFSEKYWDKWNKAFVQQKSSSRMLVHNSKSAQKASLDDKIYNRETRHLNNFPLKLNIDIFNDTVLISSFYDETAIWIESRVIASSYRIMFEAFWSLAENFK
jgi:sugar-specific transcriptional regulator TrmB